MDDVFVINKVNKEVNAASVKFCMVKDEAEDLVQQSILKILKNLRNVDCPEYFTTWVYNIVRNTYIDEHRRAKRETPVSLLKESPCLYDMNVQDFNDPNYVLGVDDASSRTFERLSTVLNAIEKKVVETTLVHGFRAREVCKELNLSANAFAKTKTRAIRKMKDLAKLSDYPPSWMN